uniref:Uncharacterized protein n=1 Tax=Trichogramma kaykai TaxID=54128 RepID=A0ABD2XPZ3_9HYME
MLVAPTENIGDVHTALSAVEDGAGPRLLFVFLNTKTAFTRHAVYLTISLCRLPLGSMKLARPLTNPSMRAHFSSQPPVA